MPIGTTSNMQWLSGNGGGGSVEYTAGHGIDIDNVEHTISVDQSEIQDKLTAGDNITITNNVISAADQVKSDWTEADTSSPAYIAHKPSIPTATSDLTNDSNFITLADVPAQVQSDWTEADSSDPAYIANKPTLATVATSGDYSDLSNTPTIPSGDQLVPSATAADEGKILTVDSNGDAAWATGGSITQVQSDWTESDTSSAAYIAHKPSLATVATSGSYSDLSGKPSIPTKTSDLTNDSNFITSSDIPAQVQSDWTESNSASAAYIAHKPSLATVATSGSYTDLSNTPSIPTKTSDLTNDSNFITSSDIPAQVQADWTESDTTDVSYIQHKPTTKPIAAGTGISVVEYADNVTISNTIPAQVQSDWAESNVSDPDYIKNKPTVKPIVAGTNVTITEANNQITISSTGAGGVPVQADWGQSDSGQPDYIKNKPTIPAAQVQSNWTETNTASKAFVLNKPTVKPIVAGTGISITETANEIIISLA